MELRGQGRSQMEFGNEEACPGSFAALVRASRMRGEAQLRGQGRSQVQLGNEGNKGKLLPLNSSNRFVLPESRIWLPVLRNVDWLIRRTSTTFIP